MAVTWSLIARALTLVALIVVALSSAATGRASSCSIGNTPMTSVRVFNSLQSPYVLVAADLTGDGVPELGAASDNGVHVATRNASGTGYRMLFEYLVPLMGFFDLAFARIDADTALDLVFAEGLSLVWLRNNGSGGFPGFPRVIDASVFVSTMDVADMVGRSANGVQDIVIASQDYPSPALLFYRNNGSGTFTRGVLETYTPTATFLAAKMTLANITGGARLDIVVSSPEVAFRANLGSGAFGPSVRVDLSGLFVGSSAVWAFGDLDGSGLDDAVVHLSSGRIFIGRDVGLYTAPVWHELSALVSSYGTLVVRDLNGDDVADIVIVGQTSVWIRAAAAYAGDFDDMFRFQPASFATVVSGSVSSPAAFVFADLNSDGLVDYAISPFIGATDAYINSRLPTLASTGVAVSSLTCVGLSRTSADFDLDGTPDLLCLGSTSTGVGPSWLGVTSTNGGFSATRYSVPFERELLLALVADLDASGTMDIIALGPAPSREVFWFANEPLSPGLFRAPVVFGDSSGPSLRIVCVADLVGRQTPELVVTNYVSVLAFNTSSPSSARTLIAFVYTNQVAVGEVSGVPGLDLVVTSSSGPPLYNSLGLFVYLNDGTGAFPPAARVQIGSGTVFTYVALGNVVGDVDSPREVVFGMPAHVRSYFWWSFANRLTQPIVINTTFVAAPLLIDWAPSKGQDDFFAGFQLFRNNGSGGFAPATGVLFNLFGEYVITDFNDDGLLDVAVSVASAYALTMYAGVGSPASLRAPTGLSTAQMPGCSGTAGTEFPCFVAQFEALASQCFPATLVLPPVFPRCGSLALNSGRGLELVTIRSASAGTPATIACPVDSGRTGFLSVGAGSSVALVDVTFALAANLSDPLVVPGVAQLASPLALCSSACGPSDTPAQLALTRVRVSDFVTAGPVSYANQNQGFGAVVVFGPSVLTIVDSLFERNICGSAGAAVSLVGAGASVVATRTTFVGNTATGAHGDAISGGGGGALVLLGNAQSATIANCTFAHNAASGGTGGAIMVRATGGATLSVDASVFADNTAAIAGGALALAGSALAAAQLTRTSFERNAAGFGGAIAAFSSELAGPSALNPIALSSLPPGGAVGTTGGGTVTLDAACQLGDSRATFGALFFACAAFVNASAATVRPGAVVAASDGGAASFRCNAADGSTEAAAAWVTLPVSLAQAQLTARYGERFATPPAQLAFVGAQPPDDVQSAVEFGSGAVVALDAYGQRMAVPSLALRLALATDAPAATASAVFGASAVLVASIVDATYSLAPVAPSVRGWPAVFADAGALSVPLVLAVDAGGVASRISGSPVLAFTVRVTGCKSGWGRASSNDSSVPLVCAACSGGTYTTAVDAASGAQCRVCPLNTVQQSAAGVNGTADTACVCKAGFYAPTGEANTACSACPAGGVCAGGTAAPTAAAGFFPDGGVFVACPLAGSCASGGVCTRGYSGRLCGKCARGYYSLNAQCRPCRQAQTGAIAVVLVLLALAVTVVLFWFNLSASLSYKFVAAMLGFTALQVIALFGKLRIEWGPLTAGLLTVASALSLNIQLASPECSLSPGVDAWTLKWALMLALPVFAAVVVAALALVLFWPLHVFGAPRFRTLTVGSLADAAVRTWYQILVLMQLPLTAAAMSPFGCRRDESGVAVLVDDPARVCYDARWWRLFAPALIFSLLYGVVLPGYVWLMLARARARADPIAFTLRYGFLVARFVPSCYAGEIATMAFKGALVIVTTFFATSESKVGAGALVVVGMFGAVAFVRPLRRPVHNVLAIGSLAAIAVVLVAGTLEAATLREALASIAIVLLVLGLVLGNAFDLWQLTRAEQAAGETWKRSDALGVGQESVLDESGSAMSVPLQSLSSGAGTRQQSIVSDVLVPDWSADVGNPAPGGEESIAPPPPLPPHVRT